MIFFQSGNSLLFAWDRGCRIHLLPNNSREHQGTTGNVYIEPKVVGPPSYSVGEMGFAGKIVWYAFFLRRAGRVISLLVSPFQSQPADLVFRFGLIHWVTRCLAEFCRSLKIWGNKRIGHRTEKTGSPTGQAFHVGRTVNSLRGCFGACPLCPPAWARRCPSNPCRPQGKESH